MQVTILVIIYEGSEFISIYDSEKSATAALMEFIKSRWSDRFDDEFPDTLASEDDCARRFFAFEGETYIIGEADLSELEAHLEAKS